MTAPVDLAAVEARQWQPNDRAWSAGSVWRREAVPTGGRATTTGPVSVEDLGLIWCRDDWNEWSREAWRSDADMDADPSTVLLATTDGPVEPPELRRLRADVARVRELHSRYDEGGRAFCSECVNADTIDQTWPCATVAALGAAPERAT